MYPEVTIVIVFIALVHYFLLLLLYQPYQKARWRPSKWRYRYKTIRNWLPALAGGLWSYLWLILINDLVMDAKQSALCKLLSRHKQIRSVLSVFYVSISLLWCCKLASELSSSFKVFLFPQSLLIHSFLTIYPFMDMLFTPYDTRSYTYPDLTCTSSSLRISSTQRFGG